MTSASLSLQGAIVRALRAAGVADGRVFDAVPETADFPQVSIGPSDEIPDEADCVEAWIVTQQIDVWSRTTGFPEARRVAEDVRAALHRVDLDLADFHLTDIAVRQIRYQRDPDGLTNRAIVEVRAFIERPAEGR